MELKGSCHCGNIKYVLDGPLTLADITARACGCSFCVCHGAAYTSHPDASLEVVVADAHMTSRYRFGTETAEFFICSRCGVVPFVTSEIDEHLYAVVNVNTFVGIDKSALAVTAADFAEETTDSKLDRRQQKWIPRVYITGL